MLQFVLIISYLSSRTLPCLAIVGGEPADPPPKDDPVVFVARNNVKARIFGNRDGLHYVFKGLRYAEPPIGNNRFQRPKTFTLQGDINATEFGSPCLQPSLKKNRFNSSVYIGSEDCLFLNVFSPELPDGSDGPAGVCTRLPVRKSALKWEYQCYSCTKVDRKNCGLPVIVWIHGGGFRRGSASQYEPKPLVNKKLVVVTIQYRLGSLGYLSTGSLRQPGNAALFDISLALRWIRDYISFFGGNGKNIVTMGQGSGATSALLLSLSKITTGFQHGVIAMSGSSLSQWALDEKPKITAKDLAEKNGCPVTPDLEMIKCLQNLPVEKIMQSDDAIEDERLKNNAFESSIASLLSAGPVSEGEDDNRALPNFLQFQPLDAMRHGLFSKIPLLTGVNKDETSGAVFGNYKKYLLDKFLKIPNFLQNELVPKLQQFTNILRNGFLPITDSLLKKQNIFDVKPGLLPTTRKKRQIGSLPNILNKDNKTEPLNIPLVPQNNGTNIIEIPLLNFGNYLKLNNANDPQEALNKIAEITADALFNLPAFLTVDLWSKKGVPSFMYRFEHKGNAPKGNAFLNGLPLVKDMNADSERESDFIGHGDELAYLFNPSTATADDSNDNLKKSELNLTKDDAQVRNIFTDLISQFAFNINNDVKSDRFSFPKFSEKDNAFLSIKAKPSISNNFRFCEMALWGGLSERLKSSTCEFLSAFEAIPSNIGNVINSPKNSIEEKLKTPNIGLRGEDNKNDARTKPDLNVFKPNKATEEKKVTKPTNNNTLINAVKPVETPKNSLFGIG